MLGNKKAIITGAGRGIGRVISERFAKEGASLALISRTELELIETLEIVKQYSPDSLYYVADISKENEVKIVVEGIQSKWGNIDVLVNNAGVQNPIGPFYKNNLTDWKRNIEINLFGTVNLTYHVLKNMINNKRGKIINLSGGGSTSPRPNFSAYAVAKTAIVRFTENLAEEVREFNIDVNAIAPGAINTKMLEDVLHAQNLAGNEYNEAIKRKKTGGNDPELAASLICFLASGLSDGITGKLISAPWDPWKEIIYQNELRNNKDVAVLRRIDNKNFYKKT
jgi:NAD(P)-dependent dehydrogenase (short-subunit alcohol dehydrogenase family)